MPRAIRANAAPHTHTSRWVVNVLGRTPGTPAFQTRISEPTGEDAKPATTSHFQNGIVSFPLAARKACR